MDVSGRIYHEVTADSLWLKVYFHMSLLYPLQVSVFACVTSISNRLNRKVTNYRFICTVAQKGDISTNCVYIFLHRFSSFIQDKNHMSFSMKMYIAGTLMPNSFHYFPYFC